MIPTQVKTALTIAGSDPSGGAGIQADLKTFAAHEIFGKSVITSITSQNTVGVRSRFDLPAEVVAQQLAAVLEDGKPGAVKTGMLGNESVVESVARLLKKHRIRNLVIDPVIRSTSGKTLLTAKGVEALRRKLLPLALLVTPNLKEAEVLSGFRIKNPGDRIKAARAILKTGVKNVLITGGHLKKTAEDFFYNGGRPRLLSSERLVTEDRHGTGCVLSAAIVSHLASGGDIEAALNSAKRFMDDSIVGVRSGKGAACVEPLSGLYQNRERFELLQRVSAAIEVLKKARIGCLVPEVQSNIAVAVKGARQHEDVVAFPGRIARVEEDIVTLAPPRFGGSRHVANVVLTVMRYDPCKRAVMNIRFSDDLLKICKKLKYKIAFFDRAEEPRRIRKKEGSSLEWGTDYAIRQFGSVPDIIYDRGGMGKEEMIRVIAGDVDSLVDMILKIRSRYK